MGRTAPQDPWQGPLTAAAGPAAFNQPAAHPRHRWTHNAPGWMAQHPGVPPTPAANLGCRGGHREGSPPGANQPTRRKNAWCRCQLATTASQGPGTSCSRANPQGAGSARNTLWPPGSGKTALGLPHAPGGPSNDDPPTGSAGKQAATPQPPSTGPAPAANKRSTSRPRPQNPGTARPHGLSTHNPQPTTHNPQPTTHNPQRKMPESPLGWVRRG